jgi:hypothetical protein
MENVQELLEKIYAETKGYMRIKITLKEPKVITQFTRPIKTDKRFNEDGRLIGWTKKRMPKKEYIVYLKQSSRGFVCLSNRDNARYIYPYYNLFNDTEIESIERYIEPSKDINWKEYNRNYIIKNIHPNMWKSLKDRLLNPEPNEPEYILTESGDRKIKTVSMSSKFPKWVCESIKESIENKKDFRYSTRGTKRDLSVEISLKEDGTIYGWYSSEYAGCGNGAYYLLINPTTAIFAEYD